MEMTKEAEMSFNMMRFGNISEWADQTIIPPPFNIIEIFIRFFIAIFKLAKKVMGSSGENNSYFGK